MLARMLARHLRLGRHVGVHARRCATHAGLGRSSSPWGVLGVSREADLDDCKEAYRKLALALHPDTNPSPDAAARFAVVVEAYQSIAGGGARGGPAGLRGAHTVGGVLVVTLEALRQDPRYAVHTCRLILEEDSAPGGRAGTVGAAAAAVAEQAGALHAGGGGGAGAGGCGEGSSDALSTEHVHEVTCSPWDSVADLRQQLQVEVDLPERMRYVDRRGASGGHELIFRSQLMGEHLLLQDYGLVDGDTLHFAVRQQLLGTSDGK